MRLIGISGTNGAGKDVLAHILADEYHLIFAGATEMFVGELRKRGWPIDRKHKAALSAEWRREHGMGVIVDKAVEMFNADPHAYSGVVVGSLRHPGEVERVHELGGIVLWVDADPQVRYARISHGNRGRGAEDDKTFEQFMAEEAAEMHPSGDSATLNMSAVKEHADATIFNNSTDPAILRRAALAALDDHLADQNG